MARTEKAGRVRYCGIDRHTQRGLEFIVITRSGRSGRVILLGGYKSETNKPSQNKQTHKQNKTKQNKTKQNKTNKQPGVRPIEPRRTSDSARDTTLRAGGGLGGARCISLFRLCDSRYDVSCASVSDARSRFRAASTACAHACE
jgi:hypothetical protein